MTDKRDRNSILKFSSSLKSILGFLDLVLVCIVKRNIIDRRTRENEQRIPEPQNKFKILRVYLSDSIQKTR